MGNSTIRNHRPAVSFLFIESFALSSGLALPTAAAIRATKELRLCTTKERRKGNVPVKHTRKCMPDNSDVNLFVGVWACGPLGFYFHCCYLPDVHLIVFFGHKPL